MIFGEESDFAIEAYHEPSGPKWGGCGRLCLHLKGVSIGDIRDNHCSLFAVTDRFREVSGQLEGFWAECFAGLSDSEVFRLIDDAIYSDASQTEIGINFPKFDFLTNAAEMFDGTKTFIVCDPNGLVRILYELRDDVFRSGSCTIQTFRRVAEAYIHWFDEQVRNTAPPYFPINPFDLNERVPEDWNP